MSLQWASTIDCDFKPRVALIGAGRDVDALADCVRAAGRARVIGYCAPQRSAASNASGMPLAYLGDDETLLDLLDAGLVDATMFGFAGAANAMLRSRLADRYDQYTHRWWTAIHPCATISDRARIGDGTVICANAAISAGVRLARHCVVFESAVVGPDATVGDFVVVSARSVLGAGTTIGESTSIGAGAVVMPGVSIGARSIISEGALIRADVPAGAVVVADRARGLQRTLVSCDAELEAA